MPPIQVYVTSRCPYCVMAKRLLDRKGLAYETIDVTGQAEKRVWLMEASGQRTVPQIFIGEKSIGGYTELAALNRSGDLDAMLGGS